MSVTMGVLEQRTSSIDTIVAGAFRYCDVPHHSALIITPDRATMHDVWERGAARLERINRAGLLGDSDPAGDSFGFRFTPADQTWMLWRGCTIRVETIATIADVDRLATIRVQYLGVCYADQIDNDTVRPIKARLLYPNGGMTRDDDIELLGTAPDGMCVTDLPFRFIRHYEHPAPTGEN